MDSYARAIAGQQTQKMAEVVAVVEKRFAVMAAVHQVEINACSPLLPPRYPRHTCAPALLERCHSRLLRPRRALKNNLVFF
jgi:hypothetical protein